MPPTLLVQLWLLALLGSASGDAAGATGGSTDNTLAYHSAPQRPQPPSLVHSYVRRRGRSGLCSLALC